MIHHSSTYIRSKDIKKVIQKLQSGMIANGTECELFKSKLAKYFQSQSVLLTNNGTSALVVALKLLKTNGSEIILPSYVCKDVIEAVLYSGFKPVLCDIDELWNVSYRSIQPKVTKKTAAIIVPHNLGISANMNEIKKLGVPIIEDCCQSIGAYYGNKLTGTIGDLTVLSFNATKCLTTGEGGAVLINNSGPKLNSKNTKNLEHIFRMSDLQASLGISQMDQYEEVLKKRKLIGKQYFKLIDPELTEHFKKCKERSMFFRFLLFKENNFLKTQEHFKSKQIAVRKGIDNLLHRQYKLGNDKDYKNSVNYFKNTISIPIYPSLKKDQVEFIARSLNEYFDEN